MSFCLQHHQKEIEIQVNGNEEEAFEKRPPFDLLWTYPIYRPFRLSFGHIQRSHSACFSCFSWFLQIWHFSWFLACFRSFWHVFQRNIRKFCLYCLISVLIFRYSLKIAQNSTFSLKKFQNFLRRPTMVGNVKYHP